MSKNSKVKKIGKRKNIGAKKGRNCRKSKNAKSDNLPVYTPNSLDAKVRASVCMLLVVFALALTWRVTEYLMTKGDVSSLQILTTLVMNLVGAVLGRYFGGLKFSNFK